MGGAIREYFLHGEEMYELRRSQFKIIADRVKIVVPELLLSYKQRLDLWIEQYKGAHMVTTDTVSREACERIYSIFGVQTEDSYLCSVGLRCTEKFKPDKDNTEKIKIKGSAGKLCARERFPVPQSGNINSYMTGPPEHKEQVISFKDEQPGFTTMLDSLPDATSHITHKGDASLQAFFARPLKIQEYQWAIGASLYEEFNPWSDVFSNARVINRMANYKLLKAKICVKMLINGNGFYYGRAIASYTPLPTYEEFIPVRALIAQDLIRMTQRPHIYLDPSASQGGTLCMPSVWFANAMDVTTNDIEAQGVVTLRMLNPLKHANGATAPIIISVFAWLEDVELSVPTSVNPLSIVPQSSDEYGDRPASSIASAISKAAGRMENIPSIGPYMRSTAMVAGVAADVAKHFGYSRPVETDPPKGMKPQFCGVLANTNVPDTSNKLSMDVKQELTIDPRVVGLADKDELNIKHLAMKESFLTTFTWATENDPEDRLFNALVSPIQYQTALVADLEVHLTPMAFAAIPFKYWRGSLNYRFQFAASAYHKGRIRIVYEPTSIQSSEYNVVYSHIVDLSVEQDFTMRIGWGSKWPFLETQILEPTGTLPWNFATEVISNPRFHNGNISVYVLNSLTTPNSVVDNNISVNVFVSASDDFEVAVPNGAHNAFSFFPQSGPEPEATYDPYLFNGTNLLGGVAFPFEGGDITNRYPINHVFTDPVHYFPVLRGAGFATIIGFDDDSVMNYIELPIYSTGSPSDWPIEPTLTMEIAALRTTEFQIVTYTITSDMVFSDGTSLSLGSIEHDMGTSPEDLITIMYDRDDFTMPEGWCKLVLHFERESPGGWSAVVKDVGFLAPSTMVISQQEFNDTPVNAWRVGFNLNLRGQLVTDPNNITWPDAPSGPLLLKSYNECYSSWEGGIYERNYSMCLFAWILQGTGDDRTLFTDDAVDPPAPANCWWLDANIVTQSSDEDHTTESSKPEQDVLEQSLARTNIYATDDIYSVVFGEVITSFRQLLKRYEYHSPVAITGVALYNFRVTQNQFPSYRNRIGVRPCNTTLVNWLTPAYTTRRGGMRWNLIPDSALAPPLLRAYNDFLASEYQVVSDSSDIRTATGVTLARAYMLRRQTVASGEYTTTRDNPVLEIEVPFYTNRRFYTAKSSNMDTDTTVCPLYFSYGAFVNSAANTWFGWNTYVAAAEDFSLSLFTGCPPCYRVGINQPT